ncbi:hypothetical protein [Metamycoplasma equirhinis]|uniref:hypothetical protein n=1 Tax=Metamycoplasma equirhinis TaxID=92402 RepID=UPI003592F49A
MKKKGIYFLILVAPILLPIVTISCYKRENKQHAAINGYGKCPCGDINVNSTSSEVSFLSSTTLKNIYESTNFSLTKLGKIKTQNELIEIIEELKKKYQKTNIFFDLINDQNFTKYFNLKLFNSKFLKKHFIEYEINIDKTNSNRSKIYLSYKIYCLAKIQNGYHPIEDEKKIFLDYL